MSLRDRLFKKQESNSQKIEDTNTLKYDVFISYSTKDKHIADTICYALEQNGLKCWIAPRNITTDLPFVEQIDNGIRQSKLVVLVFSRYGNESKYVLNEIKTASKLNKTIIPFVIDGTFPTREMEFLLINSQYLIGYPSPEAEVETLIKTVFKLLDETPKSSEEGQSEFEDKSHEIYISYSSRNQDIAEDVCNVLEENNLKCWIAPRDIVAGKNYAQEIINGIKESQAIVLIFSKYSMESRYTQNEIQLAFDYNKPILAFKIDDNNLPEDMKPLLTDATWLDGYPSPKREFDRLVTDVTRILSGDESLSEKRTNQKNSEIFISYSDKDVETAFDICNSLEKNDLSCWLKDRQEDSQDISDTMNAIVNSKLFILIFSQNSNNSRHVQSEVDIAFSQDVPILIFRTDKSELNPGLEFFIRNQPWIDGSDDLEKGTGRLVDDVLMQLGQSQVKNIETSPEDSSRPFKAYDGDDEPYIFISYKHADTDLIIPIIRQFHDKGYNVWFDHGLKYGEDYDDLIDFKIDGSSLFVIFITENVIAGAYNPEEYMKKELDVAGDTGTKIFPIFLHQIGLKGKYRMQLRGKHSIFMHEYDSEDEFIDDCIKAFKEQFGIEPSI